MLWRTWHIRVVVLALATALLGCSGPGIRPPRDTVVLEEALMKESAFLDIVYEDGAYSYVSYLTGNDVTEGGKRPACPQAAPGPADHARGVWIWDYRRVMGRERETVERLRQWQIGRIYIQIGDQLEPFRPFIAAAKASGMEVHALDGEPGYITNYSVLIERIERIRQFNLAGGDVGFVGIQIDVEPYLKKDFNLRKQYYMRQFLKMARDLRQAAKDIRLSFALPFWFDTLLIDGRPLSFHVMDLADEVVIMSYRTDYDEILESASDELCYGSSVGKPVYLGLEINRLPDEEHFVVERSAAEKYIRQNESGRVSVPGPHDGLPVVRRYTVKADKLSFFSRRDALPLIMYRVPPFKSFRGYVIHSYEGL